MKRSFELIGPSSVVTGDLTGQSVVWSAALRSARNLRPASGVDRVATDVYELRHFFSCTVNGETSIPGVADSPEKPIAAVTALVSAGTEKTVKPCPPM